MLPYIPDNEGTFFVRPNFYSDKITFAGLGEVTATTASEGGAVNKVRAPSYHKLDSYESERLGLVSPFHSSQVTHAS